MITPTVMVFLYLFVIQDFTCGFLMSKYTRSVNTSQLTPQSPCPTVFQYKNDRNGNLIGAIKANKTDREGELQLDLELSIEISVEEFNGNITLTDERRKVINEVMNGEPIFYRVLFPPWRKLPPTVTSILVNGKQICTGPRISVEMELVMTTTHLQHKLSLGVIPPEDVLLPPHRPSVIRYQDSFNIRTTDMPAIKPDTSSNTYNVNPSPKANPSKPSSVIGGQSGGDLDPAVQTTNSSAKIGSFNRICGRRAVTNSVIMGGEEISEGMFPWLAAMFTIIKEYYEFRCTASLISEKHVLTAAKCLFFYKVQIFETDDLLFVFGKSNLRSWGNRRIVRRGAVKMIPHPDYSGAGHGDVSIVTLDRPVKFSETISPICLWSGNDSLDYVVGKMGTVAGWRVEEGAQKPGTYNISVAKSLDMLVLSNEKCLTLNFTSYALTSQMTFCAEKRNGKGTCVGDVGGPFMIVKDAKYYIRGLASAILNDNDGRCNLSYVMAFADVAKFAKWIMVSMTD